MNNLHFITYATHSEGTFEDLIKNKENIPIKVLGWGEKWNGFMDKFINVYAYIQTLPDDDIIIFIDGFDSKINQPIDVIKKTFYEFNSNIVLSTQDYIPFIGQKKIFGTCQNDLIANSGLYAGYNKDIKNLLKYILDRNYSDDDQTNLNEACQYIDNIVLDNKKKLFNNQSYYDRYFNNNSDSCFISTPGDLSFNRIKRVPKEYLPFIWKETIAIIIFIIFIIYIYKNKDKLIKAIKIK